MKNAFFIIRRQGAIVVSFLKGETVEGGDGYGNGQNRQAGLENFFQQTSSSFMRATACLSPRKAALATMEWPMFSSSISVMAAMGRMF